MGQHGATLHVMEPWLQQGAHRVVVLVEDDQAIRSFLRMFLERGGFEVHEAADGIEALALVQNVMPHLVITDLSMPNMDGPTLIGALKGDASSALARVPVVCISGANEELQGKAMAAGARLVLRKPVLGKAMLQTVLDVLGPA